MDKPRCHPLKITVQQKQHASMDGWNLPDMYLDYSSTLVVFMDSGCYRTIYKYNITKFACFRLVARMKTTTDNVNCTGNGWIYYPKYMHTYKDSIRRICSRLFKKADEINILLEVRFEIHKSLDCSIKCSIYDLDQKIVIQWLKEWLDGSRSLGTLRFWVWRGVDWWSALSPHFDFDPPVVGFRRYEGECTFSFLHRQDRSASLWCVFFSENGRYTFEANPCCKRSVTRLH